MIVLSVTDCPPSLRGDLSKWLLEINTGVYVGKVSARVREELWKRVKEHLKHGRATLVFTTNNEQGMDFYVHNTTWKPVDFDGLKLMMRPLPAQSMKEETTPLQPRSTAAVINLLNKKAESHARSAKRQGYIVLDIETTGTNSEKDSILELAAIHILDHHIENQLSLLVQYSGQIPEAIVKLTGITDGMLRANGIPLSEALKQYSSFVGNCPIVCHNAPFDRKFLKMAFESVDLDFPDNRFEDTLFLARQRVDDVENYQLSTLAAHFSIPLQSAHRALDDCVATFRLYEKLNEIE